MSERPNLPPLDPRIQSALRVVARQIRVRTGLETALTLVAVTLAAFWVGFLVDRTPTYFGGREMPWTARGLFLVAVIGTLIYLLVRGLLQGPLRPLSRENLALLLERRFKQLDGRLLTSVQLLDQSPTREQDFAPSLLERVHRQAAEMLAAVRPSHALKWEPVGLVASFVMPMMLATFLFFFVAPAVAKQAAGRLLLLNNDLWPRSALLEAIGLEVPLTTLDDGSGPRQTRLVEFSSGVIRVARGEPASLRVRARAIEAIVPDVCTVYYRTASGLRGQANMRRAGKPVDDWQLFVLDGAPLDAVSENMRLEVRGHDARIDDLRIEVVDPPAISSLDLAITPPEYLLQDGMGESVRAFQPGIRVPEGARVQLRGKSTSPLFEVLADSQVAGTEDTSEVLKPVISGDGNDFTLDLGAVTKPIQCRIVPIDSQFVRSTAPYRYLISVVPDLPPELTLRLKGIGDAVTPRAVLPAMGQAKDDYRVLEPTLSLVVASSSDVAANEKAEQSSDPEKSAAAEKAAEESKTLARPLNLQRDGAFAERVDLEQLSMAKQIPTLTPGMKLTVFAEARDAFNLGAAHAGLSDRILLEVVSPDDLLARLERDELSLRSRLQEVIRETEQLRELLDQIRREGWPDAPAGTTSLMPQDELSEGTDRNRQLMTLRARQASLQMTKSRDETLGIVAGVDDILEELANNRLDTPDRRDRLVGRVRQPLGELVDSEFVELVRMVDQLPTALESPEGAQVARNSVTACERVLLKLDEILKGMLELEGYNELLDLVRELIEDQGNLIERTEQEQKKRVLDLFN